VSLNEAQDFFKVRSSSYTVREGQRLKLVVDTSQVTSTDRFKAFTLERRQCRYPEETLNNSMFKVGFHIPLS